MMYRVSLILALIFSLLLIGCASQQYVPKEDEELYGTWVNTDYSGAYFEEQKIVISADKIEKHSLSSIDIPPEKGKHTIIDKWTDSEGNILYKRKAEGVYMWFELDKISRDGTTLEVVYSFVFDKYPTEIDPNHKDYRIYHRQK